MPKLTQKTANKAKKAKTLPQDATKNVEEKGLFINSLSLEIEKLSIPRFRCEVAEILEHKHNDEIEEGKCELKLLPTIFYHCYEGTGILSTKKDYEKYLRQNLWPRINDKQEHWSQQGIEKPKLLILRLDTMPTSLGTVDSIDSLLKTALV